MDLGRHPESNQLRPIVPLVIYQGQDRWTYSTSFADLFAEAVRDWPGIPRFDHTLVDQSGMQPENIQGEIKVRMMQLLMLAAYHPDRPWQELVIELMDQLSALPPSDGINYVRVFLLYLLQTQEREAFESFSAALQRRAPQLGDELMTYAQELLKEGEIRAEVRIIENLLQEGMAWSAIERITGVNETQFQALKQRLEEMNDPG